ncbi:MAG: hypothetical protein EOM05_10420 [Clostridia bacterium]|nr:hypothetical protein [Clostridia bacterium]
MKKYLIIFGLSAFLFACGSTAETKTDELTPEQEEIFVSEEIEIIESSVDEVEATVEAADDQVEELLKDI